MDHWGYLLRFRMSLTNKHIHTQIHTDAMFIYSSLSFRYRLQRRATQRVSMKARQPARFRASSITSAHISLASLFIVLIHVGRGLHLLLVQGGAHWTAPRTILPSPACRVCPAISTASPSDTRPHMLRQMHHVRHHLAHGLATVLPLSFSLPCFQILSRILILSRYHTSSSTRTAYIRLIVLSLKI